LEILGRQAHGARLSKALSTLENIVADFGDYSRVKGDNLSPNSATVDEFGDIVDRA